MNIHRRLIIAGAFMFIALVSCIPHQASAAVTITPTTDKSSYTIGGKLGLTVRLNCGSFCGGRSYSLTFTDSNPNAIQFPTVTQGGTETITYSATLAGAIEGAHIITVHAVNPSDSADTGTASTAQVSIAAATPAPAPAAPAAPTAAAAEKKTNVVASGGEVSIPNPIKCADATCLIGQVIKYILGVIAIIATFMFVWGGIMMLTSGGNADQVKKARETLVWATIGIIVILLSWAVIRFVLTGLVGATKK